MKIRSLLTKVLSEEKITDLNGSFNKDYLETLSVLKLAEIFKSCVDKVIIEFGDDSKKILAKMSKSLIERGRVIIGQKGVKSPDEESWQEKSLEQFFIGIGAKLDKKIAIEFYTAQDGAKAHVKRHIESKIFFNRKEHVANFIDLCTEDVLKGKVSSKFIELIAEMIDTVAHEIVHLNEGADCKSTHDRRFHEELSKLDGKLFVSHETLERSPLALLKEYLPTHL